MFLEKYMPSSLKDFVGNPSAVETISKWIDNWKDEKKKSLLLLGPHGTGKTLLVQLLAKEKNLFLVHTDASDRRSASALKEQFGSNLQQQTLLYRGRIILFDEVDALSGRGDFGASKQISEVIEASSYPVILTATDPYDRKLEPFKKQAEVVKFTKVYASSIEKRLKDICQKENILCDEKAIKTIALVADGDLRAAINDLEALMVDKKIESKSLEIYRDTERSIFDTLKVVFKTATAQTSIDAAEMADKDPNDTLQWIRENIPFEYTKPEDYASAYRAISRADIFIGRIRMQQYWRFVAYAKQLMSAGVSVSKRERYSKFFVYKYPSKIAKLGRSRFQRTNDDKLLSFLAKELHCSKNEAKQYMPLLNAIERGQPELFSSMMSKTENVRDS